jgi:hypothetical protein
MRILGQSVTFTEDVRVQLAEMNRRTDPLHPVSMTNVLGNEGRPNGN